MSFRESWIQGLIDVFDCDRDAAECIVSSTCTEDFFRVDPDPSLLISIFTYPMHPESDVPVERLSIRELGDVAVSPAPYRSPFSGFNLIYFTAALEAMPKPQRR